LFQAVIHQRTILGTIDGGQFGTAILNLGDLNGDGRDGMINFEYNKNKIKNVIKIA
jgi:hypothetical protein